MVYYAVLQDKVQKGGDRQGCWHPSAAKTANVDGVRSPCAAPVEVDGSSRLLLLDMTTSPSAAPVKYIITMEA